MKRKILNSVMFVVILSTIISCNRYTITTFQPDQKNGSACPDPIYIATMGLSAEHTSEDSVIFFKQERMTLVSLLEEAKKKYGNEVTIHNIRWDVKNGKKKTGVIYDVIKCK